MKSIMKKATSILLIATMLVAYMPMMALAETEVQSSGTCGDNMTWEFFEDGELSINGEGEMYDFAQAEDAPWYSIKDSIEKVTFKDGVTSIGENAFFYYPNLKIVNIPYSVMGIGTNAFYSCPITDTCYSSTEIQWSEMYIGSNNNKLKNATRFHYQCTGCAINETRIEPTCTKEGSLTIACENCSYSNTEILTGGHKYYNGYCTICGEKEVIASGTTADFTWVLYSDGEMQISGSGNMSNYPSPGTYPWYSMSGSIKKVVIGCGVKNIGNYAFYGCNNLTDITIPDSVTSIGKYVFYGCNSLTSITIPDEQTSIFSSTFENCSSLKNIEIPDSIKSIDSSAFSGCSSLTNMTIPDSVTTIGNNAFYGCSSLTGIMIPDSVTTIGDYAFYECSSLTRITIPNSVTTIGEYAFASSGLTNIVIPEGITYIVNGIFSGCSSLTEITIPDNITSIGRGAFSFCSSLTEITIPDSVTSIGSEVFSGCSSLTEITIPDSVTSIGGGIFSGCSSLNRITLPEGITSIDASAFSRCSSLSGITIPDSVTYIDSYAFYECKRLKNITIPDGVTSIGRHAFSGCNNLISITIPNSVTSIDEHAFSGCNNLTSITISSSLTSIGSYAFYRCSSLTGIIIPESVTYIGSSVFRDCSSLQSIIIPDKVTSIGDYAFEKCSSLTSITIPESVTTIGNNAFSGCRNLTSIAIPEGVTSISDSAFSGCVSLIDIVIPNSVTTIGEYAFAGNDLTNLVIPEGVTSIGKRALWDCDKLTCITLPASLTYIGQAAFWYSDNLKYVFYAGSEEDWELIEKCSDNPSLQLASIHYNAENHIWNEEWTIDIAPSCTEEGSKSQHCLYCDEKTNVTVVPVTNHNTVKHEAEEPTCTEAGHAAYESCKNCDYTTYEEIPATGHNMDKTEAKDATCTEDGNNEYYTCSVCSKVYKDAEGKSVTTIADEVIPARGHTPGPEATCTEPRKCTVCDEILVKALGHDIVQHEGKAATCTEAGNKAYVTCTRCDYTTFEEIKVLDHSWDENFTVDKQSTCIEEGSKSIHCTVCEAKKDITTIEMLPHAYGEWIINEESTCTKDGNKHRKCANCNAIEDEIIPATGHTPGPEATCTEPQKCTVCGEILVNATGHTYKDVVTRATLSSNGKIVKKCSKCSEVNSTTTIYRPTKYTLSTTAYTYDGGIKKPTVTVKNSAGKTLVKDTDYTLTYSSGRKYVGKYSVKINFKGKYSGSKTLYFNINPPKTSLTSLTASSKGFTAKWSKKTTQVTGYQIQYSTSSKFTNPKTVTITKNSTTYKKITKLTAKKRYYVRVRTYKTVGSTKYYSPWSSYKSVITRS